MTAYLQKSFSVNYGGSQQYRDNHDAIFGNKAPVRTVEKSDIRKQVEEFHRAFDQPVLDTPQVPADERVRLRLRLITEEYLELLESVGAKMEDSFVREELHAIIASFDTTAGDSVDLVEFADALGDLDYVIEGTRLEFGINGAPIAAEIHRSNRSKLVDGKPVYREDGKVAKGPNYSPADVAGELRKQAL